MVLTAKSGDSCFFFNATCFNGQAALAVRVASWPFPAAVTEQGPQMCVSCFQEPRSEWKCLLLSRSGVNSYLFPQPPWPFTAPGLFFFSSVEPNTFTRCRGERGVKYRKQVSL